MCTALLACICCSKLQEGVLWLLAEGCCICAQTSL